MRIRVSSLLTLCIAIYLPITWASFALRRTAIIDFESLVLMTAIMGWFVLTLRWSGNRIGALYYPLVILFLLFFATRFFVYALDPQGVQSMYPIALTPDVVNRALRYLLFGTIAMSLGLFIGGWSRTSRERAPVADLGGSPYTVEGAAWIGLIAVCISIVGAFRYMIPNANAAAFSGAERGLFGFLTLLVNNDAAMFILIVVAAEKWQSCRSGTRRLTVAALSLYIVQMFLGGSRGALLRPALFFVWYYLARWGDARVKAARLAAAVTVLTVGSLGAFYWATSVRSVWYSGEVPTIREITGIGSRVGGSVISRPDETIEALVLDVSMRLRGIDNVALIVNHPVHELHQFLSLEEAWQTVANRLVPGGNPYPDSGMEEARIYGYLFLNHPLAHVEENYNSYMWTIWGTSFAHFGWWGGLSAMFVFGLGSAFAYGRLLRLTSPSNLMIRVWFVFLFGSAVLSYGLDTWVYQGALLVISGVVITLLLHVIPMRGRSRTTLEI